MRDAKKKILFTHGIHLSQYLDEEVDPSIREDIARSLESNPELQDEVDGLRDTISVLNRLPNRQIPEGGGVVPALRLRRRFRASEIGMWEDMGRFPIEAVFHIILMALLIALYFGALPAVDLDLQPASSDTDDSAQKAVDGATY